MAPRLGATCRAVLSVGHLVSLRRGLSALAHSSLFVPVRWHLCAPWPWLAVDGGHVRFVVALAGGWRQVAEPVELVVAEVDSVGGGVLLDAGDPSGAGDRGDVVALGEQPGQGDLRRCGAGFGGDGRGV